MRKIKKNMFKTENIRCIFILFSVLFFLCSLYSQSAIENVYLFVIDGVRPDILEEADTPNLDYLIENGSYSGNVWTVFPSTTLAAIPSLHTGAPPEIHQVSDWDGEIRAHTLTEVFREQGKKVVLVRQSGITGNYQADHASGLWYPGWVDNPDRFFTDRALALIDEYEPYFLNWYSSTPDNRGHRYGHESDEYKQAIELVDMELGRFFDGLKERDLFDNALLVVTTDHGMTGRMHGRGYDTDMRIFSIWHGPYIRKGFTIPDTIDIPAMPPGSVTIDIITLANHKWSSETVSWNNQPEFEKMIASRYIDSLGWHSWDVTEYMQNTNDEYLSIAMIARENDDAIQYRSVFFNTREWWKDHTYLEIVYKNTETEELKTKKVYPELELFVHEEMPDESFDERQNFFIGRNYYLKGRAFLRFSLPELLPDAIIDEVSLNAWCWRRWPPEGYEKTSVSHKIIDIAPTIAFLTQVNTPRDSRGRIIVEILREP